MTREPQRPQDQGRGEPPKRPSRYRSDEAEAPKACSQFLWSPEESRAAARHQAPEAPDTGHGGIMEGTKGAKT